MEYFTDNICNGMGSCILAHQIGISVDFTHVKYEQPHAGRTSIRGVIVMLK